MKSLLQLHISVLLDVGRICSIDITRDIEHITKRCEDEGDSFLTITLPKLAKALERGLDQGVWPAHEVNKSFVHHRRLPALLRGFFSRIFDANGDILETPDTDCIWAVRQICYLTHKVERECTPDRIAAAYDQFVSTDEELTGLPGRLDPEKLETFSRISRRFFGTMFQHADNQIANWELVPKHGPGAVAERLTQKDKRQYSYWTERLEAVFPKWRYTTNTPQGIGTDLVPMTEELPVRVISVPKTQSTPRIIAIEPSSVQYAQQGLKRLFYEEIARGPLGRVLGFQDQERNRSMAQHASVSQDSGTLDLSEASDRIHWFLIYTMLKPYPHLWEFVWACRSYRAEVPGYGIIPLQKFASMGSALTFPFEAMVFTILIGAAMEQTGRHRVHPHHLVGRVSVYGDDLIIPVDAIDCAVDWLEHFGAKVNRAKSFWTGRFRESCGAEFYNGTDVSVVRARSELPSSRSDAAEIAALVDLRNRAYRAGLWAFSSDLDKSLVEFVRLPIASAYSAESDAYLHQATFLPTEVDAQRFNSELQRPERRVPVLVPNSEKYVVEGEAGLLEWFHDALHRGDLVDRFASKERASSFSIKRRWVCAT